MEDTSLPMLSTKVSEPAAHFSTSELFTVESKPTVNPINPFRRSKRLRPPDANKELVVLMPGDDPIGVLNILPNEIEEFTTSFYAPLELDEDEVSLNGQVLTPRVKELSNTFDFRIFGLERFGASVLSNAIAVPLQGKRNGGVRSSATSVITSHSKKFQLPPTGEAIPGYSYTEYDLDSGDEDFVTSIRNQMHISSSSLNSKQILLFTNEHLRRMVTFLEREIQESKPFTPLLNHSEYLAEVAMYLTEMLRSYSIKIFTRRCLYFSQFLKFQKEMKQFIDDASSSQSETPSESISSTMLASCQCSQTHAKLMNITLTFSNCRLDAQHFLF